MKCAFLYKFSCCMGSSFYTKFKYSDQSVFFWALRNLGILLGHGIVEVVVCGR